MAGHSGKLVTLAVGKQTAKGTPQTTAAYKLKPTGGNFEPKRDTFSLAECDTSPQQGADVVVGEHPEGSPEFYLRPNEMALLAYLLMGANADGGSSPNYTHTATLAAGAPYSTWYRAVDASALVDRYEDVRIAGGHFKGQAGQPLTGVFDVQGLGITFGQADPVLATSTQAPLVYPQVTCTLAGAAPGSVESFSIDAVWNQQIIQADKTLAPYDMVRGVLAVSGVATLLFETDADYRNFHTNSPTGTAASQVLFVESLDIKAMVNTNLYVDFNMASVAVKEYPVPLDPAGNAIRVAIGFRAQPDPATIANYFKIVTANGNATP